MQRDPIVARVSELMRIEKMLTKSEIKAGKVRHVWERARVSLLLPSLRRKRVTDVLRPTRSEPAGRASGRICVECRCT